MCSRWSTLITLQVKTYLMSEFLQLYASLDKKKMPAMWWSHATHTTWILNRVITACHSSCDVRWYAELFLVVLSKDKDWFCNTSTKGVTKSFESQTKIKDYSKGWLKVFFFNIETERKKLNFIFKQKLMCLKWWKK